MNLQSSLNQPRTDTEGKHSGLKALMTCLPGPPFTTQQSDGPDTSHENLCIIHISYYRMLDVNATDHKLNEGNTVAQETISKNTRQRRANGWRHTGKDQRTGGRLHSTVMRETLCRRSASGDDEQTQTDTTWAPRGKSQLTTLICQQRSKEWTLRRHGHLNQTQRRAGVPLSA